MYAILEKVADSATSDMFCIIGDVNARFGRSVVSIPILDDPISYDEVSTEIKNMKPNKACGPDGVPPGVFRSLPAHWIVLIMGLFNLIFSSASYPVSWTNAKMFKIFKRGSRKEPKNYRGITIINSIAKLYDLILWLHYYTKETLPN